MAEHQHWPAVTPPQGEERAAHFIDDIGDPHLWTKIIPHHRNADAVGVEASREVAELETVARQSLSDVREAVAGFRQPDLAGELSAARQLLDAAAWSPQEQAKVMDEAQIAYRLNTDVLVELGRGLSRPLEHS